MTDQPNHRATPEDIEAALQSVRDGLKPQPPSVDAPAPETPLPEPPPPGRPRRRDWLGTTALMAMAALIGGAAASFAPLLTGLSATGQEDTQRRFSELESRVRQLAAGASPAAESRRALRDIANKIEGLEVRVRALEATAAVAPALADPAQPDAALAGRVEAVEGALAALKAELDEVTQKIAAASEAPPAAPAAAPAPVNADAAQLAELAAQITQFSLAVQDLSGTVEELRQRVQAMESTPPAATADQVAALKGRVAALEEAAPDDSARQAALAAIVGRMASAAAEGRPFKAELDALKKVAPEGFDAAPFEARAATGVPTAAALSARLAALDGAIRAGASADRGGDWLDDLARDMAGLVTVRRLDEPQGDAPEDRLDRARSRAGAGDLASAADELDGLQGQARAAAAEWIDMARARVALDAAIADLNASILGDLTRERP